MTPRWLSSTHKHGVPREEAAYAIVHATVAVIPARSLINSDNGGIVWLYIGPAHGQTVREIEVLVEQFTDGREAVVFHVQPLSAKWSRYRQEHVND